MNGFLKMSQMVLVTKKSLQSVHPKLHLHLFYHTSRPIQGHSNGCLKHFRNGNIAKLGYLFCLQRRLFRGCSVLIPSVLSSFNNKLRSYATDTTKFSVKNDLFKRYVDSVLSEYDGIVEKRAARISLGKGEVQRLQELTPLKQAYEELMEKYEELQELNNLKADDDMKELAEEETKTCLQEITELEDQIVDVLTPREHIDECDIILEVESGAGGQEAMLFAQSILEMYENHAAHKGWQFERLDSDITSLGGIRSASATVSGKGVYREMKFEGGIHRVQRIPVTERAGRIHTSTISVAILPQPSEIDLTILPKELKIETLAGSGPGGQHVQKNETAVRMTHIPTGTTVFCAQERSQIQNKKLALTVLRSRLYNKMLEEKQGQVTSQRKIQVGRKNRSEKIRTYNYQQGRITDHRIGKSVYNIDLFLQGGPHLTSMTQELLVEARREELEEQIELFAKNTAEKQVTRKK